MKSKALIVNNVSKKFKFKNKKTLINEEFYALKNINLEISKGEKLGIIGNNGAGKSTLLKLISKIILPTSGEIIINGKLNSLLEVGIGFDPEISGRDNIYLNGSILGLSNTEIDLILNDVIIFSELNEFIDVPVKNLSSGMYSRLAFSVGINIPGDILAIDEVLSVGDILFREKALKKMNDIMVNNNKTILFVSHNMNAIKRFCNKLIWLEKGEVKLNGSTNEVLEQYLYYFRSKLNGTAGVNSLISNDSSYRFISFDLKNKYNISKTCFDWSETINIEMTIEVNNPSLYAYKGFHLFCSPRNGVDKETQVFAQISEDTLPLNCGNYKFRVTIPHNFLASGNYYLTLFIFSKGKPIVRHQMLERILSFSVIHDVNTVLDGDRYHGVINPVLEWNFLG